MNWDTAVYIGKVLSDKSQQIKKIKTYKKLFDEIGFEGPGPTIGWIFSIENYNFFKIIQDPFFIL